MSKEIPYIDLEDPTATSQIGEAAEMFGFFQILNHGIPEELIARVWSETRNFFSLPRTKKLAISRTRTNPRGYYDRELTKNARDLKEVFDFAGVPFAHLPEDHVDNTAAIDGQNQWPDVLPVFRNTMLEYFDACVGVGLGLLEALCRGLGIHPATLHSHFSPTHTSFVRLNYYPLDDPLAPQESAAMTPLGDMALHHHTDAGALTILLQDDVGGLQVCVDDQWIDIEPAPGALVINVGDMMQVWSNDRYSAALHRVLPRSTRERYSLPFFFNPSYDTDYAPLARNEAPKYRTISWGEFRQARTDGDYADYGKEIQISDYRV